MCFSAGASFAAGGGLMASGVASWRMAPKKLRMVAVIPLLFATQQILEGGQWLVLRTGVSHQMLGLGYVFFAFVFWPTYIPLIVYKLDKERRRTLSWFLCLGIVVSLYLLFLTMTRPLLISICGASLFYRIATRYAVLIGVMYLSAVCGSLLASSKREIRIFGAAVLLSAIISGKLYFINFVSVWCFFAAVLSSLIVFYIWKENRHRKK